MMTEHRLVTDGRTDGLTPGHGIYRSMHIHALQMHKHWDTCGNFGKVGSSCKTKPEGYRGNSPYCRVGVTSVVSDASRLIGVTESTF